MLAFVLPALLHIRRLDRGDATRKGDVKDLSIIAFGVAWRTKRFRPTFFQEQATTNKRTTTTTTTAAAAAAAAATAATGATTNFQSMVSLGIVIQKFSVKPTNRVTTHCRLAEL